ncbi:MAG: LacI family transcriptional regulator [Trueperaceae bacterium]|nr:LacI family transcriptional regulator [Trueperaceae bacterium]
MTKSRVTLKQVAERAGVSVTTVSLVLNRAPGSSIGASTRARVLAVAESLGYVASAAARTLVSGRAQTVGLIICHAEHLVVDAYIPQTLYGVNRVAHARGFRVLVEAVEDVTRPDAYHELVRAKQIDGLIVLNPRRDDERLPELVREGFPIVALGTIAGCDPAMVYAADDELAREAVEHLLRLGHLRIGHVTFAPDAYLATDARRAGYRTALLRAGVTYDARDVALGNFSAASGAAATRALLELRPDLTAIFCGNDTIALGALAALAEAGRRVPDDMAVVGYDDLPTARYFVPALTTVAVPAVEHGSRAMELLADLIEGRTPLERRVRLDARLVIRRSCGAPETWRTPGGDDPGVDQPA